MGNIAIAGHVLWWEPRKTSSEMYHNYWQQHAWSTLVKIALCECSLVCVYVMSIEIWVIVENDLTEISQVLATIYVQVVFFL